MTCVRSFFLENLIIHPDYVHGEKLPSSGEHMNAIGRTNVSVVYSLSFQEVLDMFLID